MMEIGSGLAISGSQPILIPLISGKERTYGLLGTKASLLSHHRCYA